MSMTESQRKLRITKLREQGREPDLLGTTPEQRLDMMWQLALDTWAFMGDDCAESRLPRHVVRIVRRRR